MPHGGVDDGIEPLHRVGVAEYPRAETRTVERPVGAQHPVAELGGDRREHRRAGLLHVANDLVRVDDDRAVLGEATGDRGLARGDASGEGDEWHASSMPWRA